MVYKNLEISTVVDTGGFIATTSVYKNLEISTVVDPTLLLIESMLVYKNLEISTVVDQVF